MSIEPGTRVRYVGTHLIQLRHREGVVVPKVASFTRSVMVRFDHDGPSELVSPSNLEVLPAK